jgi:hypothetical protein
VELFVEEHGKSCSVCKKFKSLGEFYKQGDRYESRCKLCKNQTRKKQKTSEPLSPFVQEIISTTDGSGTCQDLGLSKEEFSEVIDFFQELVRLSRKGKIK